MTDFHTTYLLMTLHTTQRAAAGAGILQLMLPGMEHPLARTFNAVRRELCLGDALWLRDMTDTKP